MPYMTNFKKIDPNDEPGQSKDLLQENIARLKSLFPEIVTEGKIDFDALREVLGEELEDGEEFYRFTWAGKTRARREAHKPSTGTLRPAKEKSLDWDSAQNLYIEGDNLEVLKLLQKSYAGKIKMIYIDPPYNTGKDFVYRDNYKDNLKNYQEATGQVDGEGNRLSTNSDSDGRYHSNWLNMMYPRLRLARNLLSNDGVIFVSIGDDELSNLEKLLNEIFGVYNKVASVPRIAKRTSNKGTYFKPTKDYVLVYSKKIDHLSPFGTLKEVNENDYPFEDENGKYRKNGASLYQPSLDSRPNQRYYIKAPDGTFIIPPGDSFPKNIEDGSTIRPNTNNDKVWRWSRDTYLNRKNDLIFTESDQSPLLDENGEISKWNIYDKVYMEFDKDKLMLPEDVIYSHLNSHGTKELKKLNIPFSFSKPSSLIKYFMEILNCEDKNYLVLDFFGGSSTTADSVFKMNLQDGGNRKFIIVQLQELVEEKSEAFSFGFKSISEIGRERIKRASNAIKESHPLYGNKLDLGFKAFTLDSSNIKSWDGNPDNLEQSLLDARENIKPDRSEEDVLYEILLKYGLDLTLPVEERIIGGKKVFNVGRGSLFICLGDNIAREVAKGIGQWKEECDPEMCRAIFKDSGFTDVEKANSLQILKNFGIQEIRSV